jgi:hypothetical protein
VRTSRSPAWRSSRSAALAPTGPSNVAPVGKTRAFDHWGGGGGSASSATSSDDPSRVTRYVRSCCRAGGRAATCRLIVGHEESGKSAAQVLGLR